jgi:hypothetical protein
LGSTSNNSGTGNNVAERPNEISDPNLAASQRTPLLFFNTAAFANPIAGVFGNAARNTIIGPGSFTTNLALQKGIRFGKDQQKRMDIRMETANTLNHPNFSGLNVACSPAAGSTSCANPLSQFGRVQGAKTMRTVALNLRFNF